MAKHYEVIGLETIPEVKPGDPLAEIIVDAAIREGVGIKDGDVIVIAQKVVSKSEGRLVKLSELTTSPRAKLIAKLTGKDPHLVEAILMDAADVLKIERGHVITLTRQGIVCANSGVDASNVSADGSVVTLLPEDPAGSAERIRRRIMELTGKRVAVVITDTYGRPLREGVVNMAIAVAGMNPFRDYRGTRDRAGYVMRVTVVSVADEVAAAAELVMGQGSEGIPVVIVRGLEVELIDEVYSRELNMDREKWLFK